MKIERSHNAVRNMKASFISKIVGIIGPFVVRTVFIKILGTEFLGINSLYTSILNVLSLTELGFGSAIVFNMYRAIADDDYNTINALLFFYRKVYRYVGGIILGIGLLLIPLLPYLVNGTYPETINPVIVYLIFLGDTVISYFMFAYLGSLLNAFQRDDVSTLIGVYIKLLMYVLQIILLLTVKNYYAYLAVMPVFTVFSNIRTALVTRKMFPQYRPVGKLSKEIRANIKEKVGGLVIQKLCSVSRNAFDSIFVSMFLGLTQIAIYNNYYYIMSSVTAFMTIATNAVAAGAGNSVASETKEKNHQDMMRMNFIYMWIGGWCTICLLCLYQNFMELWVGKNLMLPMSSVILFCLYFYVLKMGDVRYIYDQACGIWWQNRYRAIAEALANICLNYFFGKYFGINGIIAATLISLFIINFCYGSQIIYKYYFTEQKINMYFFTQGRYFVVSFGIGLVLSGICSLLPVTLIGFAIKLVICAIVPNILYFLLYRRSEIYHEAIPWILNRVGVGKDSIVWKLLN